MAKQKKKRNKVYTGADSAAKQATVTRISAVHRSKIGQWWFDNKRIAKPVLIGVGIVVLLILIIVQIINIAS